MAGLCPRRVKSPAKKSCTVDLEGSLHSGICSNIITEVVKYILYQRQQIPQPYDQLKQDVENENDHKPMLKQKQPDKKTQQFIEGLDQIFEHLTQAFTDCHTISTVLVLVGGILVAPKEVYELILPEYGPGGTLSLRAANKAVFRALVRADLLADLKCVQPGNIALLIQAPRDSGIEWFVPKNAFSVPSKGQRISIELHCHVPAEEDLSVCPNDDTFEMSGVARLDESCLSNYDNIQQNTGGEDCVWRGSRNSDGHLDSELERLTLKTEDQELIWFQAPVIVKGVKDKSSKSGLDSSRP